MPGMKDSRMRDNVKGKKPIWNILGAKETGVEIQVSTRKITYDEIICFVCKAPSEC